ncbi:hypothetical protein, partial [Priestia megaterium]|uniref:hypothetical protein n=1 Tax=Priestia megaterium TaxID=1404 RepID=UPI0030008FAD
FNPIHFTPPYNKCKKYFTFIIVASVPKMSNSFYIVNYLYIKIAIEEWISLNGFYNTMSCYKVT